MVGGVQVSRTLLKKHMNDVECMIKYPRLDTSKFLLNKDCKSLFIQYLKVSQVK